MWKLLLISLLFIFFPAMAHDHEHPELNEWYKSLSSRKGPCCDGSDAISIIDPDWTYQNKPHSHYRVRLDVSQILGKVDMQWVDVDDDALVHESNRAGVAKVWPWKGYLGVEVRCFLPGPGI